jgi:hypothetical protein
LAVLLPSATQSLPLYYALTRLSANTQKKLRFHAGFGSSRIVLQYAQNDPRGSSGQQGRTREGPPIPPSSRRSRDRNAARISSVAMSFAIHSRNSDSSASNQATLWSRWRLPSANSSPNSLRSVPIFRTAVFAADGSVSMAMTPVILPGWRFYESLPIIECRQFIIGCSGSECGTWQRPTVAPRRWAWRGCGRTGKIQPPMSGYGHMLLSPPLRTGW